MTDVDTFLPWAAGFFDGEGSINIVGNQQHSTGKRYLVLDTSISQVDPRPLLEIKEHWGGAINIEARSKQNSKWKDACRWHLRNMAAENFLRDIRPWCRVKGEQIDIALAFRATFRAKGGSARIPEGVLDLRNDLKRQLEEGRR